MRELFVLDACALLALIKKENGADSVAGAYRKANKGKALIIMNKVNLFEVYYGIYRETGKEYADKILNSIKQSLISISEFSDDIFIQAGYFKAKYKVSLADSIVLAQAFVLSGSLLTADHHEFDAIEEAGENIRFSWIRGKFAN